MVELVKKMETSHWWWLDSRNCSKRSPWLQSTLSELDRKTKAMLKLIEGDADSFAQRAEMYYKKRPELIIMVEDFYRAHRSLAERYDLLKSDGGSRLLTTLGSPFSSFKYRSEKSTAMMDHTSDSCSETFDAEDYAESEVEDPEHDEGILINTERKQVENPVKREENQTDEVTEEGIDPEEEDGTVLDQETGEEVILSKVHNDESVKLRVEVERLKQENKVQKAQLMEKDEEKRKVLSELSNGEVMKLRIEVEKLKEENRVQKSQLIEKEKEKSKVLSEICSAEVITLRVEVDRLIEENKAQKAQLIQKDEEKSKVLSEICNGEVVKLRLEVERLMEESKVQKAQLIEQDREKSKVLSEICNGEVVKLRLEVESLMEENKVQKAQLIKKDKEKNKVVIDLCNDEVMKLREEVERLKEEDLSQKAQLMEKDEEKREVIRQLSLAIQVLKDQNMVLKKSIIRDFRRKWNPFDFSKMNAGFFGKLLNGSQKFQAAVVAL